MSDSIKALTEYLKSEEGKKATFDYFDKIIKIHNERITIN